MTPFGPAAAGPPAGLRRRGLGAAVAALLVLLLTGPVPAETGSARDTIVRLDSTLLDVMQRADSLGYSGRYERLEPVLRESFDLPYIVRVILRKHWSDLSAEQRARITDTFTRLTIATYADRFDGHSGERFKIVSDRPLRRGRMLVRSELEQADGDTVQLDYVMHRVDGDWKIVNVVANGVSDLALKRVEYGSIMGAEGFEALIERLGTQIANYREGS